MSQEIRIERKSLERFVTDVFMKLGLSREEASDSAEILVAADARGIASHGVARLWRYENGIRKGIMSGSVIPTVLRETPISLVLDANGAMGMYLSKQTMGKVIEKAKTTGAAFASIRNSNHYGIAGYYSEMAARNDMVGICMTNTAALGVPTFGRMAMFGTNPIAVSVPGHNEHLFTLDMSTTAVTRGKIEVYEREGKTLPDGWAVDTKGLVTGNAGQLLEDMLYQRGGGLIPLGGAGEIFGGHKGYGLAVMVDIMTAITSGGVFGKSVMDSAATSARVCHFFGAIRLDVFRDPEELKTDMDRLLNELNNTELAEGSQRVYYAGQKEHEAEKLSARIGVPLSQKVVDQLRSIGERAHIEFPKAM
ncbi:MAG: Ldh family oxidoreductase [Sphaerochaetaceae bacterium]|jgi:LDH2 family malate/lactate/ureidoglycolate dehydrogenase|nr:Ldh family oxidoreductase [Sphaerochaetaceae bacterium]MDD4259300.1 Ldh family oxidoreductase [Sphaerochaetaceae bacterium]MDD4842664.1 Ldh family oxidoreductase [Sphaerochaetaceae bacterium]NLO61216.1 Ldh family oxidoreductase [Spirochaetales bacterium]